MTYGPSTTNEAMADALDALARRLRDQLTDAENDLLCEAEQRIRECGDADEEA